MAARAIRNAARRRLWTGPEMNAIERKLGLMLAAIAVASAAYLAKVGLVHTALMVLWISVNMITLSLYGWDKYQAKRGGHRTAEVVLHMWAFSGGWQGAVLGQEIFRHKTSKVSFRVTHWLVVVSHVALVSTLVVKFNLLGN
jgi:uncharacterized membrane protein YsdA (DUF1294 family)